MSQSTATVLFIGLCTMWFGWEVTVKLNHDAIEKWLNAHWPFKRK